MEEDSDDSENEGGLGNVTRVVMRPPGHSGKAKRGHLCFDASFETGNLGRVDLISEMEYDLFIRPDTCNPRLRLWFNFVVDNVRTDQRVIFNIVNFSKSKNLFREGMTPIVKSTSRPKWQRMPTKHVYYYRSPEHQNHYVLSFAFGFDKEEDVYQFALSFPYSYSRCQAHLEQLETRHMAYFKRDLLALSVQERRLDLVTITNFQKLKPGKSQRVVVILSRIHPGESPTSYVCQGLIDFLVSNHPIAVALRDHVVFKIVPMMNPDGVFLGNYRSTLMGFDLNRTWHQISKWAHPTLDAVHNMIWELNHNPNVDLDFVLDLHAHSSLLGVFIYGNAYEDVYRFERHIVFPKLLAQNAEDYNPANTMYNRDPLKAGTSRRYFCGALKDSVNCYTLEVSLFGYHRANLPGIVHYTEEGYFRVGRNVARTFLDYYRATGVIPATLPLSMPPGSEVTRSRRSRSGRSTVSRGQAVLRLHGLTNDRRTSSSSSGSERSSPRDVSTSQEAGPHGDRSDVLPTSIIPGQWTFQFQASEGGSRGRSAVVPCRQFPPPEPEQRDVTRGVAGPKSVSGKKVGGGGVISRSPHGSSGPSRLPPPSPAPPSLTIIDFNKLTRGGLDLATGRGRPRRRGTRRRVSPRRAKSSSPNRIAGGRRRETPPFPRPLTPPTMTCRSGCPGCSTCGQTCYLCERTSAKMF